MRVTLPIVAAPSPPASLACLDLSFRARLEDADHGLQFLGPTIRGAFGYILKDLLCQVPHRDCSRCTLQAQCAYPAIFDGRPPDDRTVMRKYPSVPQPWMPVCPSPGRWLGAADELRFGLRFFGGSARFAPYVVQAVIEMGKRGIGPRRTQFELLAVSSDERIVWETGSEDVRIPVALSAMSRPLPAGRMVRLRFETPLDLGGGHDLRLDPLALVLAGRRRLFLLETFYGVAATARDPHLEASDFRVLDGNLDRWQIERFSGRQERRVPLGGLLGEMTIEGPWPHAGRWLQAVERIGLGKHTSFGLGRVTWQELG